MNSQEKRRLLCCFMLSAMVSIRPVNCRFAYAEPSDALNTPRGVGGQASAFGQQPQAPRVDPPLEQLPAAEKRWALVIGVDAYMDPQIESLAGPNKDAKLLRDTLVRYSAFNEKQIILLTTDAPPHLQPTRTNVLRYLSELRSLVPSDGLLLLAFSGHGVAHQGEAFLLPSDAHLTYDVEFLKDTSLWLTRIAENIRRVGVKQVLIMIDACRNNPERGKGQGDLHLTQPFAANLDSLNGSVEAFAVLYATSLNMRAFIDPNRKMGFFASALVDGLSGLAADTNGHVTLAGLVRYLEDAVPKEVTRVLGPQRQQRPEARIEGYRASELVLSVVPKKDVTPSGGLGSGLSGSGLLEVLGGAAGQVYMDGEYLGYILKGQKRQFWNRPVGKHRVELRGANAESQEIIIESGRIAYVYFGMNAPIDESGTKPVGSFVLLSIEKMSGDVYIDNVKVGALKPDGELKIDNLVTGVHRYRIDNFDQSTEGEVIISVNQAAYVYVRPSAPRGLRFIQ